MTGLSTVTVSKITRTSATFTASISTDARGSGTLGPRFFVVRAGERAGWITDNSVPATVPTAGNATTVFVGSFSALECGKQYEVTAAFARDPEINGNRATFLDARYVLFTAWSCTVPLLSDLEVLRYIASYPDLIAAFGTDIGKGRQHYLESGFREGRKVDFSPLNYVASHLDLMAAIGPDEEKATRHFIESGSREGRRTAWTDVDSLRYIASYPDLVRELGADPAKGARHYIEWGYKEGRKISVTADEALRYVASHPDLILAVGNSVEGALRHLIAFGVREGRRITFDPAAYLAAPGNGDLRVAFGNDLAAATAHYIKAGFKEGRLQTAERRPAAIEISDSRIAFDKQNVGVSASRALTIRNTGGETLFFESVGLAPGASKEFSVRSACGSLLAPGESCTVTVSFKADDRGVESTSLIITHNAGGRSSSLAVSAQGVAPTIEASASSVDFGNREINSPSELRRIIFKNVGDGPWIFDGHYTLGAASSRDSFTSFTGCQANYGRVEPGQSCHMDIRFKPAATGPLAATIHFGTLRVDGDSVSVRGSGSGPGFALSPTRLTFPTQPTGSTGEPRSFLISNPGDAPLKISEVSLSGADAAQFIVNNPCTEIPAGGRCAVAVTFKPASVGDKLAELTVRHNSPSSTGGSQTAQIAGKAGELAALPSLSPRNIDFGQQRVGSAGSTRVVRLTNRGLAELKLGGITLASGDSGDFSQTNTCGATLAAGSGCDIAVVFRPTALGARSARLSINHDAAGSPSMVALSGVGGGASRNELICDASLTAFRPDDAGIRSDLDVRDTADKQGFEVRVPAWIESDRQQGAIVLEVFGNPALSVSWPASCPVMRLVDPANFDGRPTPCDLDMGRVLENRAGGRFTIRYQRTDTPAGSANRLVTLHSTTVTLGKATLRPPILTGDIAGNQVTLAWREVADAAFYRVFRVTDAGLDTVVERTTSLSASFNAVGERPAAYVVRAINDHHESGLSNQVRLTPGSSPSTSVVITDLQVLQSVGPSRSGAIPLIAQKPGIVRVFLAVSGSSDGKAGVVRLSRPGEPSLEIRGPLLNTPASGSASASCVATFDLRELAANWFAQGDVELTVEVDHGDKLQADSPTRRQLTRRFSFVAQKPLHIKLVPMSTNFGLPSAAELAEFKADVGTLMNAQFPNASVHVDIADSSLPWNAAIAPLSNEDWDRALMGLGSLRATELNNRNCERFYYGVFKNAGPELLVKDYRGIGGVALIPEENSLAGCPPLFGIGMMHRTPSYSGHAVAVHEIGHNHGLKHVAADGETNDSCAEPVGIDEDYPHAKGRIGVTGYDARQHRMLDADLLHDQMSYCTRNWISDYHYRKARRFQERLFDSQGISGALGREGLAAAGDSAGGVLLTGLARPGAGSWELTSALQLDGTRALTAVAESLEAEVDFGGGKSRLYPVVVHDLDHITSKVFEVWIPGDEAPWRMQIRRRSGEVLLDWNSGRSESRADFEERQAAAIRVREVSAGNWEFAPWSWGPRTLVRVVDGVRSFVGNDDGSGALRIEAAAGDSIEVFATRLGTRTTVVLDTLAEIIGAAGPPAPAQGATPAASAAAAGAAGDIDAASAMGAAGAIGAASVMGVVGVPAASASTGSDGRSAEPSAATALAVVVDGAGSFYQLFRRDGMDGLQDWRVDYLSSGKQPLGSRSLGATPSVMWHAAASGSAAAQALPSSGWVLHCRASIWTVRDGYALELDRMDQALNSAVGFRHTIDPAGGEAIFLTAAACTVDGGVAMTGYSLRADAKRPSLRDLRTDALHFRLQLQPDGAVAVLESAGAVMDLQQLCAAPVVEGRRDFCGRLETLRQP